MMLTLRQVPTGYLRPMSALGEPHVELAFDPVPAAPTQARRALRTILDDDDPIREAVTLAVSELVTNVVLHTGAGGVLRAWDPKPDVPLRVEIEDAEPTTPRVAPVDHARSTGRGLRIVSQLADDWGSRPTRRGKIVWAEFDRLRGRHALDR